MTADPLSKEAAMQRVRDAGKNAALWGSKPEANPYSRSPSMHQEASQWAAGWVIGAAERKRKS